MTNTHIMLDLETWGTTPGSDIRSIGAVVFDPVAGNVYGVLNAERFYIATDNPVGLWRNGSFNHGVVIGKERLKYLDLTRDPKTVKWWNEQSEEAQAAFADPVDLHDGLYLFGSWLGEVNGEATNMSDSPLRIWAHGPQFDISILEAAYRAVSLPTPWHYRAPRDVRTILEAAGIDPHKGLEAFSHGTAHNALDDAISQAMAVCEAYKRLGIAVC